MRVAILYNQPALDPTNPDYAQEAGVMESVEAIAAALVARGHQQRLVGVPVASFGETRASRAACLRTVAEQLAQPPVDVAVNLCESWRGDCAGESWAATLLEILGLPYTGSPPDCLALVRDKARTKRLLDGHGLPTAPAIVADEDGIYDETAAAALLGGGAPVIVKPAAEDASLGIDESSVVVDLAMLRVRVSGVAQRYGKVLIERFIDGREFNVALAMLPTPECLPLAEIVFADDIARWRVLTYRAKWESGGDADRATPVQCPAAVDASLAKRLRETALRAAAAVGCRHYSRVDLRVDADANIFILEVNGNPDLSPRAGFARAWAAAGRAYTDFIDRLLQVSQAERGRRLPPRQHL